MGKLGNTADKVDRELLHQFLWKYRDRSNFVTFRSSELAEKLGISIYTMSTMFTEMCAAGRLIKKGGSKYLIVDPTLKMWETTTKPTAENQPSMF